MFKSISLLTVAAVVGLTGPAFAESKEKTKTETSVEREKDGSVTRESSTESTSAGGTTSKSKVKASTDVDSDGSVQRKTTSSDSTDPKGLMNKSSTTVKTKVSADKEGNYESNVDATKTHHDGTDEKTMADEKVTVDSDGKVTKTREVTTTTDPKGLMNKKTDKTLRKTETNPDGTRKTHVEKKVDGKTVEETTVTH